MASLNQIDRDARGLKGAKERGEGGGIAKAASAARRDPFCDKDILGAQGFYETANFLLVYNSKALTDGHALIITRRHVLGLLDLTTSETKELFDVLNRALPAVLDLYNNGSMAYDLKIRSGEFSGRTVNHFHVHIIPRKKVNDGNGGTEFERIYEMSLQNLDRPFLDSIEDDVKALRSRMNAQNTNDMVFGPSIEGRGLDGALLDNIFYESKHFVALCHPSPVIEGQAILVPKRDVAGMLELTEEERNDLMITYARVMKTLLEQYGDKSRSYVTSMQVGGYDNMPIERLHINLIPRSESDRYSGHDDDMYYDLYEKADQKQVLTKEEVLAEVRSLKGLERR